MSKTTHGYSLYRCRSWPAILFYQRKRKGKAHQTSDLVIKGHQFKSSLFFPPPLTLSSQGATRAAGRHLPAAERKQGDVRGRVGGRHGGAAPALLHLSLLSDSPRCHPASDRALYPERYWRTLINSFTMFHSALPSTQQPTFLIWLPLFVVLCCFVAVPSTWRPKKLDFSQHKAGLI